MRTKSEAPVTSTDGSESLLRAEGITKHFGGIVALDHVDLAISQHEIVALIGPNGAGKTTFVNCITGVERPNEGHVIFKGLDLGRLPTHEFSKRGLARTFQVMRPFRSMSVRENVAVGALFGRSGSRRSLAEALEKADETLQFTGLWQQRDVRGSNLSVAQSKRLELARSLAMEPDLLALDEVMAGLNLVEMEQVIQLIEQVAATGVTIVIIEHVMKAITALASRVVVLHQGRKLVDGPTAEVLNDPRVIEAYLGNRYAQRVRTTGSSGEIPSG